MVSLYVSKTKIENEEGLEYWEKLYRKQVREGVEWDEIVRVHVEAESEVAVELHKVTAIQEIAREYREKRGQKGEAKEAIKKILKVCNEKCSVKDLTYTLHLSYTRIYNLMKEIEKEESN